MPTYFLPLTTGSKKKWASKRNDFWCCQGTMIQAQTRYPELIYAFDEDTDRFYVNQYIPSVLETKVGDSTVKIEQSLILAGNDVQTLFDESKGSEKNRWKMRFEVSERTYDTFVWLQNNYRTKHQQRNFKLIPLYDVKDEAYTIYFEEKK